MKRIIFLITLFIAIVGFGNRCQSQSIKNFTSDPIKFIDEMQKFLEETDKKEGGKIMDEFIPLWTGSKFNPSQQDAIYKTANAMLRKRMKAFPDFRNYLAALTSFANSQQSQLSFTSWQASLDKLLLLPPRFYTNYITTCNTLFKDNTLYSSASTNWHSDNNSYSFEFDSLPKIVFPSLSLICTSKGDSSVIYQTKGFLYPTQQKFYGQGGKVNWNRAGWDESVIHATLHDYIIDLTGSDFSADSVDFFNSNYFNKPLKGTYSDKILANVSVETASYPRFVSTQSGIEIKNIVPDVDYIGGFSMVGNKMVGSGTVDEPAHIIFFREHKPFFVLGSKSLNLPKPLSV